MPFQTRYSGRYPSDEEIREIEGVTIVDLSPPSAIEGSGSNAVAIIGQFLKGPINVPTEILGSQQLLDTFGGWSDYSNPGGVMPAPGNPPAAYDGNGFLAIAGRKFGRLIVVNVKQDCGVAVITCTIDTTKAGIQRYVAPAGIRVADSDESDVFATLADVEFAAESFTPGEGTATASAAVAVRRVLGSATSVSGPKIPSTDSGAVGVTGVTLGCSSITGPLGGVDPIADVSAADQIGYYGDALDALAADAPPANEVSVVVSALHPSGTDGATLMALFKTHAIDCSSKGKGRIYVAAPPLATDYATATGESGVGVGNSTISRHDRVIYAWPGERTYVRQLPAAAITSGSDGYVDWPSDARLAGVISMFPAYENPAQASDYMTGCLGIESQAPALTRAMYTRLRSYGVCAPRIDAAFGAQFQSGVTTSLTPALKNIARRRMADYLQDSIAGALHRFVKTLNTDAKRGAAEAEIVAFLEGLLSKANPAAQKIAWYSVDAKSANTAARMAMGIITFIVRVRTLSSMDFIVLQTEIGESVAVSEAA